MDRKDFLLHIIKQIGDFQMQHWKSDITPSEKRDALDLVSFVDLESEKMFAQGVQKHFPEDNILGEETHDPDKQYSGQDSIWIIDPLDGTMSFLRGHPIWGVSIAYLQNDQTILAALYFPALGELLYSYGEGTFLGEQSCHVSCIDDLEKSVINLDTNHLLEMYSDPSKIFHILSETGRVTCYYCAIYYLASVACGRLDGGLFYTQRGGPWDVAAGAFLVEQAGGKVTSVDGSSWSPFDTNCVFSNGVLHEELVRLLNHR